MVYEGTKIYKIGRIIFELWEAEIGYWIGHMNNTYTCVPAHQSWPLTHNHMSILMFVYIIICQYIHLCVDPLKLHTYMHINNH